MLKELKENEIRIAWGIIPHENWEFGCGGGAIDEDGDSDRYFECFNEKITEVIARIQPFIEYSFQEWLERIMDLCNYLNLSVVGDEYWPQDGKEGLFSEEELYVYADEEDVKNNPQEYEHWDEDADGNKFSELYDYQLPWFGMVDRVMNDNEYAILIRALERLYNLVQQRVKQCDQTADLMLSRMTSMDWDQMQLGDLIRIKGPEEIAEDLKTDLQLEKELAEIGRRWELMEDLKKKGEWPIPIWEWDKLIQEGGDKENQDGV